ncbi:hypothetical protein K4K53_008541 [Colletotrichum sp. SAR 10_77]|nr:hypothetical protein K4K53_008541 [Colletotrichum sp. SAR 10_77]
MSYKAPPKIPPPAPQISRQRLQPIVAMSDNNNPFGYPTGPAENRNTPNGPRPNNNAGRIPVRFMPDNDPSRMWRGPTIPNQPDVGTQWSAPRALDYMSMRARAMNGADMSNGMYTPGGNARYGGAGPTYNDLARENGAGMGGGGGGGGWPHAGERLGRGIYDNVAYRSHWPGTTGSMPGPMGRADSLRAMYGMRPLHESGGGFHMRPPREYQNGQNGQSPQGGMNRDMNGGNYGGPWV